MVMDKGQKRLVVKDVANPSDFNIRKKERKNTENFQGLEQMWKVSDPSGDREEWLEQIPGETSQSRSA